MDRACSAVVALTLTVVTAAAAQAPKPAPTVTVRGTPAQPGSLLEVVVATPADADRVEGRVLGHPLTFVHDGSSRTWRALVGIDVAQPAGSAPVEVWDVVHGRRGQTVRQSLAIAPRRFATRSLQVASQFVEPSTAELERIRSESERLETIFTTVTPRHALPQFAPPLAGVAGSNFGTRSVFNGQPRAPHAGVDFRGSVGTPVAAPASGRIVLAEPLFFTGNTVIIDHGLGLYSLLAHLSRIEVPVGQTVDRGTVVGLLGATGRVTGPHLHWAVRLGPTRVDALRVVALLGAVE
jgi:hypothetical protein